MTVQRGKIVPFRTVRYPPKVFIRRISVSPSDHVQVVYSLCLFVLWGFGTTFRHYPPDLTGGHTFKNTCLFPATSKELLTVSENDDPRNSRPNREISTVILRLEGYTGGGVGGLGWRK